MAQTIYWVQPDSLATNYDKTRILKSGQEQSGYLLLAQTETFDANSAPITTFTDPSGSRNQFYIVRYYDSTTNMEYQDFSLGYFPFTPREKRILTYIVGWVPELFKIDITDQDLGFALRLALNSFNIQPPETNFSIDGFPRNYEQFLVWGCMANISVQKYLKVAIRDFSSSDSGLSLTIDRGAKIQQAQATIDASWNAIIRCAKWNMQSQGVSTGTVPLPLSLGGNLNKGILNILDIFNSLGR